MWKNPLNSKKKSWKTIKNEDLESHAIINDIIRFAVISCPDLFLPNYDEVMIHKLDHLDEFSIVRLTEAGSDVNNSTREFYGFYFQKENVNSCFYPIEANTSVFNLIGFFVQDNTAEVDELEKIEVSYKKYLRKLSKKKPKLLPFVPEIHLRVYDSYLPVNDWKFISQDDKHYNVVLDHVKENYIHLLNGTDDSFIKHLSIYCAQLSFSDNYKLLEIIYYSDNYFSRLYVLLDFYTLESKEINSSIINGTSSVIHNIWAKNESQDKALFVIDTRKRAYDYLKFYCWALQADEGHFTLPESILDMAWTRPPDSTEWDKVKLKYNAPIKEDENNHNSDKHILKNIVTAYSDGIFTTEYEIPLANGVVKMNNDDHLDGLPLKANRFVQIHRNAKTISNREIQSHEIELEPSFFDTIKKPKDAKKSKKSKNQDFLNDLKKNGHVFNKIISKTIILNDEPYDGLQLVIQNCVFNEIVYFKSSENKNKFIIKNCLFKQGFSANNIRFQSSVQFVDCEFYSNYEATAKSTNSTGHVIDFHNFKTTGDLEFFRCSFYGISIITRADIYGNLEFRGCSFLVLKDQQAHVYVKASNVNVKSEIDIDFLSDNENFESKFLNYRYYGDTILNLNNTTIGGYLAIAESYTTEKHLKRCTVILGQVSALGIQINGALYFFNCFVRGSVSFTNSEVKQNIELCGQSYMQNTFSTGTNYRQTYIYGSLYLNNSQIGGSLNLSYSKVYENLSLYGMRVKIHVNIFGVYCGKRLNLTFSEINGIFAAYRTDLSMLKEKSLYVGQDIEFKSCNIKNVRLEGIHVKGDIYCNTSDIERFSLSIGLGAIKDDKLGPLRSKIGGRISFSGVNIKGSLDLSGLQIERVNSENYKDRIEIVSSTIGGNLLFFSKTKLDLIDKAFDDILNNSNQNVIQVRRKYLDKSFKNVNGRFNTTHNLLKCFSDSGNGSVIIRANTIKGRLDLRNFNLKGELNLDDTSVMLDTLMNGYYNYYDNITNNVITGLQTICQNISMKGLKLHGNLNLTGLQLTKHYYTGGNLDATGSLINGGVYLIAQHDGSTIIDNSKQIAFKAKIEGDFDISVSEIKEICFTKNNFVGGRINLERSKINKFRVVDPTPQKINLNGISVVEWDFGDEYYKDYNNRKHISSEYLKILQKMEVFDKSVYISVENELRNRSETKQANKIYIAMRKEARKNDLGKWYSPSKILDSIYGFTTRYGTNFKRLLLIWILLVSMLTIIYLIFDIKLQTNSELVGLTKGEAPLFALQNCIPLLELKFVNGNVADITFKWVTFVFTIISYILLTIAIYGMSIKISRVK